jgi:uncharacterized membrane protein (UPF0136 family)
MIGLFFLFIKMSCHLANMVGATCLVGGLIGYFKSGSMASLIAGSTFGSLYFYAAHLINNKSSKAKLFIVLVSLVLCSSMTKKALSGKPVPVLLVTLGGLSGAYYGISL